VVGINLKDKKLYVCEVATHLPTGLMYVKDKKPNNVNKLTDKFSKDIEYGEKYFQQYDRHYMLWSPIIKRSKDSSQFNQERDLSQIGKNIHEKYGVVIDFVVNEKFLNALQELRLYASKETKELKNPVLRLLQIEEALKRHVGNGG
jgi:hypothetical protein